jgi:hypothetical protein
MPAGLAVLLANAACVRDQPSHPEELSHAPRTIHTLTMTTLPSWDEMTDLDRGAAIAYAWLCHRRGALFAIQNAPFRYVDAPDLVALDPLAAGRHALTVCGPLHSLVTRIGKAEYDRLYNLALPPPF